MTNQKEVNKVLLKELKQKKSELEKYKRDFEIEKNIKNGLYFFILTNELYDLLRKFSKTNDYQKEDYQIKSLEFLIENLA
ncbi:hypothetical protein H2O64_21270 [Kordia sp. YSTF-M3]|uniref:Uncharacterized protein n=1 Tax=Kordia aestuariivivens TaxID=2759037 RepID=A0ABR7QF68_9FLAO|nr:hypothetical protein [Kordia aestuariivivens]MBC8757214.1 hypothetical protein [Kordia aestuariivivens]